MLQSLVRGSSETIVKLFIRWYHLFKYTKVAKETIQSQLLQAFRLKPEFIEIVEAYGFDRESEELKGMICNFLKSQILSIKLKAKSMTPRSADEYSATSKFFGDETSKAPFKVMTGEELDQNEVIHSCEVMEKLINLRYVNRSLIKYISGETNSQAIKVLRALLHVEASP